LSLYLIVSLSFFPLRLGVSKFQSFLDLKSDAQEKADGAEDRRDKKRVGVVAPQKKGGDSRKNHRQNLKKSFHP
jgi:hypothetical protein